MPDRNPETLAARNRDTQLTVRVPAGLKRWVREAAKAAGENVSAYVAAVLEEKRQREEAGE